MRYPEICNQLNFVTLHFEMLKEVQFISLMTKKPSGNNISSYLVSRLYGSSLTSSDSDVNISLAQRRGDP